MKKTNMYPWVNKTRNFIGGRCPHRCDYCYVESLKRFPVITKRYSGKLRLLEDEFDKPLGSNKTIFVGSCSDMFANEIPRKWILRILDYCKDSNNLYLFQTKNPERFKEFLAFLPPRVILGATIETNRNYDISKAPLPVDRVAAMMKLKENDKLKKV